MKRNLIEAVTVRRFIRRLAGVTGLLLIGTADYLIGYEISLSVFYLLPIAWGAWSDGRLYAVALSALAVTVRVAGDLTAGAHYSSAFVVIWNALILFSFFILIIALLSRIRRMNRSLESQVRDRTQQILDISEREQQRIGHDLHDSLSQHLTATMVAAEVLAGRLENRASPETNDARSLVSLSRDAITMTRTISRGLSPLFLEEVGLMEGIEQLASETSERFHVACTFECDAPVLIQSPTVAMHLYRIAQEAISNAIRHGHSRHIKIDLKESETSLQLTIQDDGSGIPSDFEKGTGMGLKIMAHRAAMIGATLDVRRAEHGGTVVRCELP